MNLRFFSAVALAGLMIPFANAADLPLSFSNVAGATLVFTPGPAADQGTFQFLPDGSSTTDFSINGSDSITGSIDGKWTFGPPIIDVVPGVFQQATVNVVTPGVVTLTNGTDTLTAALTWGTINTVGGGGGINTFNTIANLSGVTLSGPSSVRLQALKDAADLAGGRLNVTFQFDPAQSLSDLAANGGISTYSGTINAVPEPLFSGLALAAGLGVLAVIRRKRVANQQLSA